MQVVETAGHGSPWRECLEARRHRELSSLWRDLGEDIERYFVEASRGAGGRPRLSARINILCLPPLLTLLLHRVAHYLWANAHPTGAELVSRLNTFVHKASLTPSSCIGGGSYLPHPVGFAFHGVSGRRLTAFSSALCIPPHRPFPCGREAAAVLGEDVTIGGQASALGPLTIGSRTRIAFRTDTAHDAPSDRVIVSLNVRFQVREQRVR